MPGQPSPAPWPAGHADEVALSWRDPVFTLEFAALPYADPAASRYAYRLRGFDERWLDTDGGKRFATYTNLDPGNYVFEVRAANKVASGAATRRARSSRSARARPS